MKKLFILILTAAMAVPSFAQFGKSHSRFNHDNVESYYGVRLGLSISSMSSDMADFDTDSRTGWTFGGVYGLQLANSLPVWLETGLYYTEKGGEHKVYDTTIEKVTYRMSYLEVPVVVKYGFDIIDDLYIADVADADLYDAIFRLQEDGVVAGVLLLLGWGWG